MAIAAPTGITGYSGFWNNVGPSTGPYNLAFYRSSELHRAAVALGKRGFRKYKAQMRALNGVAPGATATDSYKRVAAGQAMYDGQYGGGTRSIQTVTNNTTTTTAMRDNLNARLYDWTSNVQAYPVDTSGNGGGNKLRR